MHFNTMPRKALLAVVAVIVVVVAYFLLSGALTPTVAAGDNISMYYTGKFTNGTVFGSNVGGKPFNFTVGAGEVVRGLDTGIVGMKLGSNKTIVVPPAEGYGFVNASLIQSVPLSVFGNQTVRVGEIFIRNVSGKQFYGIVDAVNKTSAVINFNPPLAGQTMVFTIKVVGIKKK